MPAMRAIEVGMKNMVKGIVSTFHTGKKIILQILQLSKVQRF